MFRNLNFLIALAASLLLAMPATGQTDLKAPRRAKDSGTGQAGITPQKTPHSSIGGLASPGINNQLDQAIEEHFLEKNLPGLVVLYSRDGLLVYKKTLGFADVESQTKVNENHIFRLASVSKLIAAALALKEVEQGQLNLNAKVKSLLSEIPDHHTYRVRDLLSCRSGVRHYGEPVSPDSPDDWGNQPYVTNLAAAENFWLDPLAGTVGQYHYSTHGYSILGACLEQATGKPTAQLLRDTISIPQGLNSLAAEDRSINIPQRVSLYQLINANSVASGNQQVTPDDISWKTLGGGIECSGMDLLKFGIKLSEGKIISAASLKTMITRPEPSESYALGCVQTIQNGLEVFAKDGGQLGASSYIWCIPERRMVMVVLTNRQESGGASELGKALREIVLNTAAADSESADLVVKNFNKTSGPQYKDGHWEIGFKFDVCNIGQGPANSQFINGVRQGDKFRWSSFIGSLAPNGTQKSLAGIVKIADPGKLLAGRTIDLIGMADAPIAAADTTMDPTGRVAEENENNNEATLSVKIPGGITDLRNDRPATPSVSEPDDSQTPPKRLAPPKRIATPHQVAPLNQATPPDSSRPPRRRIK